MGLLSILQSVWDAANGRLRVDASGTSLSGTVTANQGTPGSAWPVSGTISVSEFTRLDNYTGTGNGIIVDATAGPTKSYAIQVDSIGAVASVWDVRLEGSLDNVNFSQILQHTNTTGDGAVLWSGAVLSPSLYFRSRCAGLTLGFATSIDVTILGVQ